jgi:hypothetical protein
MSEDRALEPGTDADALPLDSGETDSTDAAENASVVARSAHGGPELVGRAKLRTPG